MRILYIEDDTIDQKNMQLICERLNLSLQITEDFNQAISLLNKSSYDYIIADQYVHEQHVVDFLDSFKNIPFTILSNTDRINGYSGKLITKPINSKILEELLAGNETPTSSIDTSFFQNLPPEAKKELITLLVIEFEHFYKDSSIAIQDKDIDKLIHLTHKISSKFSILKDKNTFTLCRQTEKNLAQGNLDFENVLKISKKCNHVLKMLKAYEN